MVRILALCLCMLLSPVVTALAGEANGDVQVSASRSASGNEQITGTEDMSEGKQVTEALNGDEQTAADQKEKGAKEMSGMSIVGNDEAPKSLYIVPWKSSEIGVQTSLDTMLNEDDVPVDREVFKRQIEFYQVSTSK